MMSANYLFIQMFSIKVSPSHTICGHSVENADVAQVDQCHCTFHFQGLWDYTVCHNLQLQ